MPNFSAAIRLLAGACIAGFAGSAFAAELPVKAVPLAPSVYNWTGVYVGGHLGYGMGMKDWENAAADFDVKGFLGGGQIGFNQQVGNWVFGIEADASWASVSGSQSLLFGGGPVGFTQSLFTETKVDRFVTVAGRIGLAQDRWLVYAKLGAAWAHENHGLSASLSVPVPGGPVTTQLAVANGSETRFGPMIGFGAEYALWGNWSFKTEYNYVHMTTGSATFVGTTSGLGVSVPLVAVVDIPQAFHLTKIGLNYRFGPEGAPPIAPSRPAPGYNWTGSYVGVVAGYGFGRKEWPDFDPDGRFDARGWLAGGTAGTNVQAGVFVLGVESEWMWTGIKGSNSIVTPLGFATQTTDLSSKIDWLSLTSLRAGFVAADRWLVYVKGGIALAHEKHGLGFSQVAPGIGNIAADLSGSALHTGYLAGIGVEYAFLGNWSAKLEYNYLNFRLQNVMTSGIETFNIPTVFVGAFALVQPVSVRQEMHLVKFGINYHFDSVMDVVRARF